MNRTIETSESPELVIECKGDLEVSGLRAGECVVEVKSDDERLSVTTDGNRVAISANADARVRAPRDAVIYVASVGGDLAVKHFNRPVNIGHVGGDLDLEDVGGVEVRGVGGDCKLEDVAGPVDIQAVGGDLQAEGVTFAGRSTSVGGDVSLRLALEGGDFALNAGGDVSLALPADADAVVHITDSRGVRRVRFGDGGVAVRVRAGGEVSVSSDGEGSEETAAAPDPGDVMRDVEHGMHELHRTIEQMVREFAQRFAGAGMPAWQAERAQRQIEAAVRKMEAKLEHRLRHLEGRADREARRAAARAARAASRPARRDTRSSWAEPVEPSSSRDLSTVPFEAPPKAEATDEERIAILRMLQEKKITIAQAEQLLAALEG